MHCRALTVFLKSAYILVRIKAFLSMNYNRWLWAQAMVQKTWSHTHFLSEGGRSKKENTFWTISFSSSRANKWHFVPVKKQEQLCLETQEIVVKFCTKRIYIAHIVVLVGLYLLWNSHSGSGILETRKWYGVKHRIKMTSYKNLLLVCIHSLSLNENEKFEGAQFFPIAESFKFRFYFTKVIIQSRSNCCSRKSYVAISY